MAMTPRERVLATIDRRPVDKIPVHHIQFSGYAASVILGREAFVGGAIQQWREMNARYEGRQAHEEFLARSEEDAVALARASEQDILRLEYWRWHETPVQRLDEYNFVFEDPSLGPYTVTYHPEIELLTHKYLRSKHTHHERDNTIEAFTEQVLEEEALAEAYEPNCSESTANLIDKYPNDLLKMGGGAINVDIESEQELIAVGAWPELAARYFKAKAARLIKDIPGLAASGMIVNFNSKDFAWNAGPIISPTMFSSIISPALKSLVDACHAHGMLYFYGTDGNIWPVADEMFLNIGIDGYFEIDKGAGMGLRELRERYPNVTLIGGIRPAVLHQGSVDEVVREVMEALEVAHELSGIVVGVSNMIMPGTPPENIMALLNTIKDNR